MNFIMSEKAKNLASTLVEQTHIILENDFISQQKLTKNYSVLSFCKEYCTVSIKLPRRKGNSVIAAYIGSSFPHTAILTPTVYQGEVIKRYINGTGMNYSVFRNKFLSTWRPDDYKKLIGKKIYTIVIDVASMISKKKLNDIYKTFGPNKVYLLVG